MKMQLSLHFSHFNKQHININTELFSLLLREALHNFRLGVKRNIPTFIDYQEFPSLIGSFIATVGEIKSYFWNLRDLWFPNQWSYFFNFHNESSVILYSM